MSKLKLIVAVALIVALAAVGAGWKWGKTGVKRSLSGGESHLIAGWSWGGSKDSKRGDRDSQR
jgi:hypothetical protein